MEKHIAFIIYPFLVTKFKRYLIVTLTLIYSHSDSELHVKLCISSVSLFLYLDAVGSCEGKHLSTEAS